MSSIGAALRDPLARFPIGVLARHTGCNIETIRYYERIGLLARPSRSEGGHRMYGPIHFSRLAFVRRARELGFTVEAVRALLALAGRDREACLEVRELAAAHLKDVRSRISDLKRMERVLAGAVSACDAGEQSGCPIIEALSSG